MIFGLNMLFTSEKTRQIRVKILENGLRLNPFYFWSYKYLPAAAFNAFGASTTMLSIFLMAVAMGSKVNLNLSSFNVLVFTLVNLLMVFWALYFIWRLIVSFEKGRIQSRFLYKWVAMDLSAIPQLAILLVFVIYFAFHGLFLLKSIKII